MILTQWTSASSSMAPPLLFWQNYVPASLDNNANQKWQPDAKQCHNKPKAKKSSHNGAANNILDSDKHTN